MVYVLSRDEIIAKFNANQLLIEEPDRLFTQWASQAYAWNSPFQQCSIDLHVGKIYVPETQPNELGGAYSPKTDEHVLETGHTVMIRTKEKITLPDDIGGICFSPSRLALKAVLITNMGHVDPGYSGHLHFTAINMGKEPFTFRGNDIVCTMIFFQLRNSVPPFGSEHFTTVNNGASQIQIPTVVANYFPKLAKDFVDVTKRAQTIAKKEIDDAKLWQIGIPLLIALLTLIAGFVQTYYNNPLEKDVSQLKSKIEILESKQNYEPRIIDLENKLAKDKKTGKISHGN
jgi:deoxycytidine triphosphate deaminase